MSSQRNHGSLKCLIAFLVTVSASLTEAQILQTICSFNNTDGANPQAALMLGNDGNFYGTTAGGGGSGIGTVFKMTLTGTLTTLVAFNNSNGLGPTAQLMLGNDGNFYSTTAGGGSGGYGTVFKMTPAGTLTTLVSFNNDEHGANPFGRDF